MGLAAVALNSEKDKPAAQARFSQAVNATLQPASPLGSHPRRFPGFSRVVFRETVGSIKGRTSYCKRCQNSSYNRAGSTVAMTSSNVSAAGSYAEIYVAHDNAAADGRARNSLSSKR